MELLVIGSMEASGVRWKLNEEERWVAEDEVDAGWIPMWMVSGWRRRDGKRWM